jgi:hypothetical protein
LDLLQLVLTHSSNWRKETKTDSHKSPRSGDLWRVLALRASLSRARVGGPRGIIAADGAVMSSEKLSKGWI